MAGLRLEHIYKVYPNGTKAVSDFTMDIKDNELIVFVGPSGCGKSTTLRMIAGLEEISAGELYIGDRIVNDVEPKDRDIAMVFQNYALYPHMTVYDNMAFGLKIRHLSNAEIHKKVLWAANILGLTDYLDRTPKAMSGGQRQRVALGRAILRNPKVMLLDEPLSNLDAKLRSQMRTEIAKLHKQLKTTFIYVTHDQVEAMTLGTRVVVMKAGRIQQVGTPKTLYDYPANKFVAGFLGTPQMNFFETTLLKKGKEIIATIDGASNPISIPEENLIKADPVYFDGKHIVYIGVRCENVHLVKKDAKAKNSISFKVTNYEELGNEVLVYGDIKAQNGELLESPTSCTVKCANSDGIQEGEEYQITFDTDRIHLFDKSCEVSIMPRIPQYNSYEAEVKGGEVSFLNVKAKLPKAIAVENFKGQLVLPLNAIKVNPKGTIKGKVSKIEKIEDVCLGQIDVDGHPMFAYLDEKAKVGDELAFSVQLDAISLMCDGVDVCKHIPLRDSFTARFLNYKTAISRTNNSEFVKFHDERINKVNAEYAVIEKDEYDKHLAKLAEAKAAFDPSLRGKNKPEIEKKVKEKNDKIKALKTEYKANKAKYKADHKANVEQINKDINAIYDVRKQEEDSSYKEFLSINKDSEARSSRKREHIEFNENFPKEKANDLSLKINAEGLDFETLTNANKSHYKRDLSTIKSEFKDYMNEIKAKENPVATEEAAYAKTVKDIRVKKADDLKKAGLIYYFNLNGNFLQATDDISRKLNQGLGTKVFTKEFRLDFPHDSYTLSDEGLEIKVEDNLDYGDFIAVQASYKDALGQMKKVYIKSDKKHEVGDILHLGFDVKRASIVEIGMDIKLY